MNQYHYTIEKNYDKEISISEYSSLGYFSKKAMKQRYPKGGYAVLGGIGCGLKKRQGTVVVEGKEEEVYEMHYSRFLYGVEGYVSLGQNQYLAVIKRKTGRNILAIVGIALLVSVVVLLLSTITENQGIDEDAKDYTPPAGMNIKTDPNHIALPGYGNIQMKAGSDTAYIALWNPPTNPCYFQFKITMAESEKVLYESALIPPGKAVTTVKMAQTIEKGSHEIKIQINTFALKNKKQAMNGGKLNATIIAVE